VAIRFEPATSSDLQTLLQLMRQLQEDDPWEEPFDLGALSSNLQTLLDDPIYGFACLVWNGQEAIGYMVICFDYSLEYRGKGAWVDELFVSKENRGQGIGTQLLDLAEDASRKAGAKVLHLEVNHGNPAIELYRKRGFVQHQRFLMTKRLDG
jgi:ribosomal protein S18 acetylase RimI-like enzyme